MHVLRNTCISNKGEISCYMKYGRLTSLYCNGRESDHLQGWWPSQLQQQQCSDWSTSGDQSVIEHAHGIVVEFKCDEWRMVRCFGWQ